jgi:hypothetical protein
MVDVKVEIAWNAGFLTAAASRTWTDVSTYVELDQGLTITVGRGDERSEADANHLTLTLDNSDGRFTPGKTGGAYYPNVLLNRPIRVTGTPVDGAAQVEFLGFIDEWPIEWSDGAERSAYVTVSASSRLSRLGTQAQLKSIVETAILTDAPVAYYTLGEPAGSTQANDSSGNRADPLALVGDATLPVTFGNATGPGTDGLTAAEFQGGQYLNSQQTFTSTAGFTVACCVLRSGVPVASEAFLSFANPVATISPTGIVNISELSLGGPTLSSATSIADGATHHVALTYSGSATQTMKLYVDGTLAGTVAGSSAAWLALSVGGSEYTGLEANWLGIKRLTGTMAHVALFQTELTAAQVAALASATSTGYAGETTSARLIRYAGYAGIESAGVSAETGQTTVQHIDTTDKQPVELMRVMETTEGGVLFDHRDGTLMLQNRAHRLTEAAVFTLDMAQHMVESDYQPKMDRTTLANDITAQDISGQFTAHVFDAQSRNTDHGVATASIETASQDDDEPLFLASWLLYKYKQPAVRIPTLTVDCLAQVGKTPNCSTVLAASVGDKITVSNRPTQDSSSSASFFVEGYTRVYGLESCRTTFNVSPSSPDDTTLVIGDATRGVIGTNPVAL